MLWTTRYLGRNGGSCRFPNTFVYQGCVIAPEETEIKHPGAGLIRWFRKKGGLESAPFLLRNLTTVPVYGWVRAVKAFFPIAVPQI
jgi:hypothetical protein